MRALSRVERLEKATGIGEPCEAHEAFARVRQGLDELARSHGLTFPDGGVTLTLLCEWCRQPLVRSACDLTVSEAARIERMDALYWRGEMCLPEYEQSRSWLNEAADARDVEWWGEYADEARRIVQEYGSALDAIRQPPAPYLCRVPGCECEYPKTREEWARNARENGFRVPALQF